MYHCLSITSFVALLISSRVDSIKHQVVDSDLSPPAVILVRADLSPCYHQHISLILLTIKFMMTKVKPFLIRYISLVIRKR